MEINDQRRVLSRFDQFLILELVLEHPGIYLHELKHQLKVTTGTEASTATICRMQVNYTIVNQS